MPGSRKGDDSSGPAVALAFQRVLALVLLIAWTSLLVQVRLLGGVQGLEPVQALLARAEAQGLRPWALPTFLWLAPNDAALVSGCLLGIALAVGALAGRQTRLLFLLSVPVYLSYCTALPTFLGFQWDNLLLESLFLAAFLPADRAAPWVHVVFRLLLFRLYFESGIAKWQSHLHDWHDGSAMTFYYETAPIPTRFAWFAHQLPAAWHRLESWLTLVLELVVPFLVLGPRRARLVAFVVLTAFQVLNSLTANYGFFTLLATSLHLFLLSDGDLPSRFRRKVDPHRSDPQGVALLALTTPLALWAALQAFLGVQMPQALDQVLGRTRILNVYHLFGHITRERIEPDFQVLSQGQWESQVFPDKPGPLDRPPPFVAPHQPRVDFRLWFYGLSFRSDTPDYVVTLLSRLCHDPEAVDSLFVGAPVREAEAVRIVYWRYTFTDPDADAGPQVGRWWTREAVEETPTLPCAKVP